jgi:hypothetical protein
VSQKDRDRSIEVALVLGLVFIALVLLILGEAGVL